MSDVPEGLGWWQASDGKYYPPESFPGAPTSPDTPTAQPPSGPPAAQAPYGSPPSPGEPYGVQPNVGYGYTYGAAPAKTEPLAIWSLVLSLVSIPLLCACGLGFLSGIAAIVTGVLGRRKIKESNGALTGDGMALAGFIIGIVVTPIGAVWFLVNVIAILAG